MFRVNYAVSMLQLLLITITTVSAQIDWQGKQLAQSTVFGNKYDGQTILFSQQQPNGAQFPYLKTDTDGLVGSNDYLPPSNILVSVYLLNLDTGLDLKLVSNFDPQKQQCSCYYLNAVELLAKYGNQIVPSRNYQILFQDDFYQPIPGDNNATYRGRWASGLFGIASNNGTISRLPAPQTDKVDLALDHVTGQNVFVPSILYGQGTDLDLTLNNTRSRSNSASSLSGHGSSLLLSSLISGLSMMVSTFL
ncbi:hypothetical protein MIR68_008060 [Amoeboaphelidium protococcarum]|nr:hypothetical protein MIR68_008060 [Amoeboaphelidium protococcarum]KAI3652024.1 hypothetical protein MP228_003327 [Amoeboaphelidium protococcarum]